MTPAAMRRPALAGFVLPGLILLGACGLFGPPGPPVPRDEDTPQHEACRAEARNSPEVLALNRQMNPSNQWNVDRLAGEVRRAENRAYRNCLAAHGLGPPGGVEAQVPRR